MTVKNYYNMESVIYSDSKQVARLFAIVESVERSQNGYKFKPLSKADFGEEFLEEFKEYLNAVDEYHKALYISASSEYKDEKLIKVLCKLSTENKTINKIVKADIHDILVKSTTRFIQRMKAERREEKAELLKDIELFKGLISYIIENGKSPDGIEKTWTLEEAREHLATAKKKVEEIESSDSFEKAKISQVTPATFRKYFELFIGSMLSTKVESVIEEYITMEDRTLNKKWKRGRKQALEVEMPAEIFDGYYQNRNWEGLKAEIKERRKAMEEKAKKVDKVEEERKA